MTTIKKIMAKTVQINGCRIWQGGLVRGRWPRMYARINGKETAISVRPVLWKLLGRPDLKPGEVITTTCGNEACLERTHLEVIDKGEVSRRNWAKPGAKLLRSIKNKIASASRAKLDMEKAREIRARLAEGATQTSLVPEYKVSQALLSRVARYESWKDYTFAGLVATGAAELQELPAAELPAVPADAKPGLCACGCGTPVQKTWARGHATRMLSSREQARRSARTGQEAWRS